jgi:hypothetical protein
MAQTHTDVARTDVAAQGSSFGGFADAIGGIATVVLAIIALAGVNPAILVPAAVIVFGVALLIQGGTMLSEHARVVFPAGGAGSIEQFRGGDLSVLFLVGIAGIVLGILAMLGIAAATLTSVSVIAFGAGLILSANSVRELHIARPAAGRTGHEMIAGEMASGSAGVQLLAGMTAAVLGILAVCGVNPDVLLLSALIVLGGSVVLSGGTLSGMALSFMHPARGTM